MNNQKCGNFWSFFIGMSMSFIKKISNIAALGCLGFCVSTMVGCLEDDELNPSGLQGNNNNLPQNGISHNDTSKYVNEKGDTITVIDTSYIPLDTTVHWVGNSALLITEVSPMNMDWFDEEGGDPGWVEVYNAGKTDANLKGYSLVEKTGMARKWIFGDTPLKAGEFKVIFCDKKNLNMVSPNVQDHDGLHYRPHTNWKLEKTGGTIYLIDPYYGIRDSVKYPELAAGMSWGIMDGGAWKYFEKPTPEQINTASTAYDGVVPDFQFSGAAGGFYSGEVKLNAPKTSDGLKIRCTQDGSVPTKSSPEFNSTITISKNTVLRCSAFKDGLLTKKVVTNTYFIDEDVNMPVVAVSVDPSFFVKYYKKTNGGEPDMDHDQMYAPNESYPDDPGEMAVHVEYFEKGSSSKERTWEADGGISLMGGWSRMERKKSVAINMREEYGGSWLHYPLFKTRPENKKFKAFNLRNNGNRFVADYFADAAGGAMMEGTDVDYQRSQQVVVFYNGAYYGIHDMRERYNKNYVETNYGIDAGSVNFIKHLGKDITASNGTIDNYVNSLKFVIGNDMSDPANYAMAKTMIDVGNYADYMAAEIYFRNGDWPNNNVRAWRSPDQPWKFMIYDLDHGMNWKSDWAVEGFKSGDVNMFKWVKQGGRPNNSCAEKPDASCFHMLYNSFMKNDEFKRMFVNRSSVLLQNNLNASNMTKVVNFLAGMLNEADVARDMEVSAYADRRQAYGSFDPYGKKLPKWAESRDESVRSEYKSEFKLSGEVNVNIAVEGEGTVLMEGMKLPKVPYSGKFFGGLGMELKAVPGQGRMFNGWSDGSMDPVHVINTDSDISITAKFL